MSDELRKKMRRLIVLHITSSGHTVDELTDAAIALIRADTLEEAEARIEQLEAALRVFTCDCTISERCAVPNNCCNFQARRTLEERT